MAWSMTKSDSTQREAAPLRGRALEDAILAVLARAGAKTLSAP